MTLTYVKAETLPVNPPAFECDKCGAQANRVELDYRHNHRVDEHQVLCERCAKQMEICPCCIDRYECENEEGVTAWLLPVHGNGVLDEEGFCSDHP